MKAPWWKFWDPTSGAVGGLIFGSLISAISYAIGRMVDLI